MKSIRVIWRDENHKISISSYYHVHSLGVVDEDGEQYLRIYIDDGETATFKLCNVLSVEL